MSGQVINTNIMSLNAQRNLGTSRGDLATALQRLSSGLRINSAKDDAAGLAISERFTTQIRGLNQAVRNANDGISLSQTAEGALAELTNNLQRIRELAVQSVNATNSSSDRGALDAEVQQRIQEITRIATQTTFNGLKVLDGTFGTQNFQVGANVGDTISVNFSQGVRANQIGAVATLTSSAATTNALAAGDLTIALGTGAAVSVGASSTYATSVTGQGASSAYAKAAAINAANISGLQVTATTSVTGGAAVAGGSSGGNYTLTINGVAVISAQAVAASGSISTSSIIQAVNNASGQTGVTASLSGSTVTLTAADGRDIGIAETVTGTVSGGNSATTSATTVGKLTLSAGSDITIGGTTPGNAGLGAGTTAAAGSLTLRAVDTAANANTTISSVDSALTTVNGLRGTLGAIQNRFQSTISNLQAVSENLSASRSRILDADFASETASLTRAQILQQAGVAILAQANAVPQQVLGLLRG
jgi:flagellin